MGPPAPKARLPAAFARNFLFSISRKNFVEIFHFLNCKLRMQSLIIIGKGVSEI